jgi:hypothetical protein
MSELLACPFCGETPNYDSENTYGLRDGGYKYGCVVCQCGALGPDVRTGYKDWTDWREDAAKAWNDRAQPPAMTGRDK